MRAQIARITHSVTIVPKGLFKTVEDNDKEIEEVTFEGPPVYPSVPDMANPSNWVHYPQNILKCNRLTHPDISAEDETGELQKRIEAADPYERRLKPISLDSPVQPGNFPSWIVKLCGDSSLVQNENPAKGKQCYGVAVAKSL